MGPACLPVDEDGPTGSVVGFIGRIAPLEYYFLLWMLIPAMVGFKKPRGVTTLYAANRCAGGGWKIAAATSVDRDI
jgi:hypothetical protein